MKELGRTDLVLELYGKSKAMNLSKIKEKELETKR